MAKPEPANPGAIARAGERIRAGGLVAFPTETVYGLGADAGNDRAVAALFRVKGRPTFNPLIVHVADAEAAGRLAVLGRRAARLAAAFWPGPLTLVLARRPAAPLSLLVSAGLATVAVRAPAHEVARALIAAAGRPIAAPSANLSGRLSPTTADHVASELPGEAALILDGGPCRIGIESTVVDLTTDEAVLLRPGGLTGEAIEAVLGERLATVDVAAAAGGNARPRSPGMLARHYAPVRPLRLAATAARPGEALLGFAGRPPGAVLDLSPTGDLEEAAANLFRMLRALDAGAATGIAVAPIPDEGLGRAINDRLARAARPPDGDDGPGAAEAAVANAAAAPAAADSDWADRGPAAPCVLPDAEP